MSGQHTPHRVGSYGAAILWIALNDDTEWLEDANGSASVTLCLVADIFGRTVQEATADLRRTVKRERNAQDSLEQARNFVRAAIAKATGKVQCCDGEVAVGSACRRCGAIAKATGSGDHA